MPVRVARIKKEERERGEHEREAAPKRQGGAGREKCSGPQQEKRREDEKTLRRVREQAKRDFRRWQGDAEEACRRERPEERRALVSGGQLEDSPEAGEIVRAEKGGEGGAAGENGKCAPGRGNHCAENDHARRHCRRVLGKDGETDESARERVAAERTRRISRKEERRPRPEQASRHERMREEEKAVGEKGRGEKEHEHSARGARGRSPETHARVKEDEREKHRGQRRADEPHRPQDRPHRGGRGRPREPSCENVPRQRDERRAGRLVRVDPALLLRDILERRPEKRKCRGDLQRAALDERRSERPAREFVRREKVREDRHGEKRQKGVEPHDGSGPRPHRISVAQRPCKMRRMNVADFDFVLPPESIAQRPAPRGAARLLTLDRRTGARTHRFVADLPSLLYAGDVLVLNDTKVIPARIFGTDEKGRRMEFLLVSKVPEISGVSDFSSKGGKEHWRCLAKPGKRVKAARKFFFEGGWEAEPAAARTEGGLYVLRFEKLGSKTSSLLDDLASLGSAPLPPYIHRPGGVADAQDAIDYQTVFADSPGAIAAPTAGLHFTQELLAAVAARGIEIARGDGGEQLLGEVEARG